MAEQIGCDSQGRYWTPPASSRGLRSDAPSSRQIIVQPPAIFKSLRLSRRKSGRADIQITPNGKFLYSTERTTNKIALFTVTAGCRVRRQGMEPLVNQIV